MSGGTPTASGGLMRQRFKEEFYSSGDDYEDDATSKSPLDLSLPSIHRARDWYEVVQNFIWVASAVFIVYYGDWKVNLVTILWADSRVRRIPLRIGLVTAVINVVIAVYITYLIASLPSKSSEKTESFSSAAPTLVALGFLSFCLFSYALWPIFSVLTIPLLFTLLMALIVLSPYLFVGPLKPQSVMVRAD